MAYFRTEDGCSLYYEVLGDGPAKPTLTFINGTMQTAIYWKLISRGFSNIFRLLIYDCRGQGESELGESPLSLARHVHDLKALLFALGISETSIVGLSHGARVALALADRSPELIHRLVLCSVSTRAAFRAKIIVRTWFEILKRHSLDAMVWAALPHIFGRNYLRQNEKFLERIVKTIVRRNKTDALRAHLEAMQRYPSLLSTLKSLPFPVLVLTGEDDPLVTEPGAGQVAQICGGRHVELKGVGHSLPAEAPDQFVNLVNDFLRA